MPAIGGDLLISLPAGQSQSQHDDGHGHRGSMKILLIEDDAKTAAYIERMHARPSFAHLIAAESPLFAS